jgi:hypothetical protein
MAKGIPSLIFLCFYSSFHLPCFIFHAFQISAFSFRISDFRFHVSYFIFQISDFRFQISAFRCRLALRNEKRFMFQRCTVYSQRRYKWIMCEPYMFGSVETNRQQTNRQRNLNHESEPKRPGTPGGL